MSTTTCCDLRGDPRHPKGDPTMHAWCNTCQTTTRQSYNRDSRGHATHGYGCATCAEAKFHANPPGPMPTEPNREPSAEDRYLNNLRAQDAWSGNTDLPDWML